MRFEVPQFIEVEDKIFGPFTWKQFIYLAGGGGTTIVLFLTLPFFLFVIIAIPIAALTAFLAFHQVNNRPFSIFLESFLKYATGNKLYLWRRGQIQTVTGEETVRVPKAAEPVVAKIPTTSENNIASLARKLELNALEEKK